MTSDLFEWAEQPRPVRESAPYVPGSDTSEVAAKRIAPHLNRLQGLVLAAIRSAGSKGMTDEEMGIATGLGGSTVRPRRGELATRGLILKTTERRLTASGSPACVWVAK